ncbi:MAG: hypothetical protein ACUVRA_07900 [Candidatus Bathyarchaeaceae archaeon]
MGLSKKWSINTIESDKAERYLRRLKLYLKQRIKAAAVFTI